jgi:hypothetical protein
LSLIKRVFDKTRAGQEQLSQIELLTMQISSKTDEISFLEYYLGVHSNRRQPINATPGTKVVNSIQEFWNVAKNDVLRAEPKVVLDIGCGVRPFGLLRFSAHICLEPFAPYASTLAKRFPGETGIMPFMGMAPDDLWRFPDKSVDSVFLLDVIEHMDKDAGMEVLREAKRISRRSSHVFTPLGFMEQHVSESDLDEWGYEGNSLQTHVSGWGVEDFLDYEITVMEKYHELESGDFGAIWASHYHHEPKLPLTLNIPEALDSNSDWTRWLREIEKCFFFTEVNVSAEMAPWSFRASRFVEFPADNLGLSTASKVQAKLLNSAPFSKMVVLCTDSLARQLASTSFSSKVLFLIAGGLPAGFPIATNDLVRFVSLKDEDVGPVLNWLTTE